MSKPHYVESNSTYPHGVENAHEYSALYIGPTKDEALVKAIRNADRNSHRWGGR